MNPIMRLIDTDEIGAATVRELLHDMGADGDRQAAIAIVKRHHFTPHAAFVCLHGAHTARYMAAIEAVTREINQEQEPRS
ncbi:hypothetical protein [Modicisalibacter sp. MOD 31.J]|uniref:hypothetical protein n=1 Tax=Modicisalibacter sp. MOD 31.J TaxID=2831897 RepID=UPI001CCBC95C|nr:hypothetical protein [Modicisalibacter sp. MOD 31.J]MBZ9574390.1 hypothetical protein [Modicisalibacter sp. MOD 31.J]